MFLGGNTKFPQFSGINPPCQKTPFSIFLTFEGVNFVQFTWKSAGVIFWKEEDLRAKEAWESSNEARKGWARAARFLGRAGSPFGSLVAPRPSIFAPPTLFWPKTDYIKAPSGPFETERHRNTKYTKQSPGVLSMSREYSTPGLWVGGSSHVSLLSLYVLHCQAPYELPYMNTGIYVIPMWWIYRCWSLFLLLC